MLNLIGGAGFVGTRLATMLARHHQPFRIIDKVKSRTFPDASTVADVRDLGALQAALADGPIVNLAAEHRDDVTPRSLYDEVNVQGARNVCAAAEAKGIGTIIFTSSVAVYGFAPRGTDESGEFKPFNDYGRTKLEAEKVYLAWQARQPSGRTLSIVRPTVIFGERNRGNVYNLLRQIASGKFVMIGKGDNVKSMAYVENVAAFLKHTLSFGPGVHTYNYIDKPDFDMQTLVRKVHETLGEKPGKLRIPYAAGLLVGRCFDIAALVTGKKLAVSSIRIKKFCADSMFDTSVAKSGFVPPVALQSALANTIRFEFVERNDDGEVFYSE
ncbi:NAD-dependent epimerase/dehydratase family protein [Luteimonas suaedae]|uniref:NAD-dependent epimerase/dehydratase family protein n=1 Tax=Luteimonas suaedae TaxID=2605430 RepID=UPI0011ECAF4C|nr:NAD-dependent epimerase/dehydratase family protein [Luteimonas suaedae]